jgi:paraquat-inducible protein B
MSKQVNKTLIGTFILGAAALTLIGILALGGSNLFQESNRYVIYFSGSVKGLEVGAPVQLKGVNIGKVIEMHLVYNYEDKSFLNQVIFDVAKGTVVVAGDPALNGPQKKSLSTETTIEDMIENGFRAKLGLQSIVTGQLLVAFDFYPDTAINLMGFDDHMQELPTLPSDMDALTKTFDSVDFPAVAESISNAAKGIDELANSPELREAVVSVNDAVKRYGRLAENLDVHVAKLSTELTAMLTDIRHMVETVDSQIPPMTTGLTDSAAQVKMTFTNFDDRLQPVMANLEATSVSARDAFQQAEAMLGNLTHLSDEDSALVYRIDETMTELRKAAAAMTLLADYLSRHPEALLQGKKAAQGER